MKIIDQDLLRQELSAAQFPAVVTIEGPCLILAGAGSGKTRALTFKIAHLISDIGVDPARILAVTFTNKAAAEMKARLNAYTADPNPERASVERLSMPWMGTFHGICVRLLREILPEFPNPKQGEGWTRNFSIYDDDDQKKLFNQIFKELEASALRRGDLAPALPEVREIRSLISSWKNRLITPADALSRADNERERLWAQIYRTYQDQLCASNALDFDDLMGLTVRIFETDAALSESWSSWFAFRFVDEYQDTNPVQYRLLRLLCGWHPSRSSSNWKDANITAVGDDDQGIYSWRGADITILRDFARDFNIAKGGIFKLEQNYRSTRNIVDAASSLIAHNPKEEHLRKQVFSDGEEGDLVRLIKLPTDREEADLAAREIRVRGAGMYPHTAIFYRTNAQSRVIEESMRRAGVPYKIVGGMSFYERKEIKDLLSYLKVLVNPQDEISLLRMMNYPPRNIGPQKQEALKSQARGMALPLWESLKKAENCLSPVQARPVLEFRSKLLQWQERAEAQSLVATVEMILDESNLLTHLEQKKEDQDALANAKEFLSSVVEAFENDPSLTLPLFLQQISLQTSADQVSEEDAVTLMTLHGSKGLEFEYVYLCGCEEGFLPMARSGEAPNVEEERRLMYVGMTRARKLLTLMQATVRKIYGRDEYGRRVSPFVAEIDSRLIEVTDKTGRSTMGSHYGSSSFSSPSYAGYGSSSRSSLSVSTPEAPKRVVMRRSSPEDEDPSGIAVGKLCEHPRFGPGRILSMSGSGGDAKVKIRFGDGERTLILKYANLRPYDMME